MGTFHIKLSTPCSVSLPYVSLRSGASSLYPDTSKPSISSIRTFNRVSILFGEIYSEKNTLTCHVRITVFPLMGEILGRLGNPHATVMYLLDLCCRIKNSQGNLISDCFRVVKQNISYF